MTPAAPLPIAPRAHQLEPTPTPPQTAALVQTDAELSAIVMRAFILRRAMLLEQNLGDALVLGSVYSPRTLQIREFLSRNAHPATFIDLDRDAMAQEILDHFHVSQDQIPL